MSADLRERRAAAFVDPTRLRGRMTDFVCDCRGTVCAMMHSREAGRDLLASHLDQRGFAGSSGGWTGDVEWLNTDEPLDAWRVTFHCNACGRHYPRRLLSALAIEAGRARDSGRSFVRLGAGRQR